MIQEVLLFGLESWLLSYTMISIVDTTHMGFLLHIMGKRERHQAIGSWEIPEAEEVIWVAGM